MLARDAYAAERATRIALHFSGLPGRLACGAPLGGAGTQFMTAGSWPQFVNFDEPVIEAGEQISTRW